MSHQRLLWMKMTPRPLTLMRLTIFLITRGCSSVVKRPPM
ncbi:hypothetical protein E2C01_052440 [Portunus trituberculatus]|uniref:Uncharacterized protein n=1 Tax=Portunus trituberculatus TaxID=210409 RepID=A0A5B7GLV7_PORTR|nr:hypothetical protein [Portunus trituberculatus]